MWSMWGMCLVYCRIWFIVFSFLCSGQQCLVTNSLSLFTTDFFNLTGLHWWDWYQCVTVQVVTLSRDLTLLLASIKYKRSDSIKFHYSDTNNWWEFRNLWATGRPSVGDLIWITFPLSLGANSSFRVMWGIVITWYDDREMPALKGHYHWQTAPI